MFQSLVRKWYKAFGITAYETPTFPSQDRCELRIKLIEEEFTELKEAIEKRDLVAVADALTDLHFVISGSSCEFGIDETRCFKEVYRSNMSKIWPDGSVHIREDGKVLKPPTYSPPDLSFCESLDPPQPTSED